MPPATPADRVRLLRAAFLKTLSDPEFVNDARQAQLDIDPISGEDVTRLIGELFRMPPSVLAKLKELLR
jgi:tripartite-type tricarboxylate transporter receptor subunit TctC